MAKMIKTVKIRNPYGFYLDYLHALRIRIYIVILNHFIFKNLTSLDLFNCSLHFYLFFLGIVIYSYIYFFNFIDGISWQ
ncbi:hypothetical protein BwiPL1_55300 (plasmid) [Bacillus wiedmannii]|nr:hypothetical protein BwiPL1_55300 [Bacillus wiedmannii]